METVITGDAGITRVHESTLRFLGCPRCGSRLELAATVTAGEVEEGFLDCGPCSLRFPVICKIPILWDSFAGYLSGRASLGGRLLQMATHHSMREFVRSCLPGPGTGDDWALAEQRWSAIYRDSKKSRFYSRVRGELDSLGVSGTVLEYGSSIGIVARHLSACELVFGIDKSFDALCLAKQTLLPNADYVVADFMSPVFGSSKFDLVVALNVLEMAEPRALLGQISRQVIKGGTLVMSDPYDFERGRGSVREPIGPGELRSRLRRLGFGVSEGTAEPSHIPWNLKINRRTTLKYLVDLVVAEKL